MKIYGKKHAVEMLGHFRSSGRFPHALLFYGPEGIGKHTLADYTAMMYVCENRSSAPCMTCGNCRKVLRHIHPDYLFPIPAVEAQYKKDKSRSMVKLFRDFMASCYIRPNDGDIRVIVFEKLDKLSVLMQNTLLKFIEEPLEFNRYIFLAENRAPILQTVLSRVTAIEAGPADEDEFTEALAEHDIPSARAHGLYETFGGNIGAAVKFEKNGDELIYLRSALAVCDAVSERKEYDCLKAFLSLKKREDLFAALGIISDILSHAATYKSGTPEMIAYRKQTENIASGFSLQTIVKIYDEVNRLYGMSFTNPNVGLFAAECCGSIFSAIG